MSQRESAETQSDSETGRSFGGGSHWSLLSAGDGATGDGLSVRSPRLLWSWEDLRCTRGGNPFRKRQRREHRTSQEIGDVRSLRLAWQQVSLWLPRRDKTSALPMRCPVPSLGLKWDQWDPMSIARRTRSPIFMKCPCLFSSNPYAVELNHQKA